MAVKNTSVSLGNHLLSFAQHQVVTGRYSSTSDVVRAGLCFSTCRRTSMRQIVKTKQAIRVSLAFGIAAAAPAAATVLIFSGRTSPRFPGLAYD